MILPRPKELKEFNALAQTTLHHLGTEKHLSDDRCNFSRPEIKPPVKCLKRIENPVMAEIRVMERRKLDALVVDQLGVFGIQPTVLNRLLIKECTRVRRGQGDLYRVGIDPLRKAHGLLDGLHSLPRQTKNERPVDCDPEIMTVFRESL